MTKSSAKDRRVGKWLRRLTLWLFLPQLALQADQTVYDDALQNGWQNWGWATLDYANTSPVHSGSDSISVTMSAWQGIQLYHPNMDSTPYFSITFWLHGGTSGGQNLKVYCLLNGGGASRLMPSVRWWPIHDNNLKFRSPRQALRIRPISAGL